MILKVNIGNGWMFISNLYKTEYREMTKVDAQNLPINKEFYCRNQGIDSAETWVKVHYLFVNGIGLHKVIVTDTNEVYLLNDEGKTIERIN